MDKLKYVKLENEDGSYSESIPLAVDSNHVDINGRSLSDVIVEKADARMVDDNIEMLTNEVNLANSRIDNLARLEDGSTTGDAELIDGRTAYTGRVYNSIGENLRTSFEGIYNSLEVLNGNMNIAFGRYGWTWVDENTAPVLGTYAGGIHNTTPTYLRQGSTIKVDSGAKYNCFYLSDYDNKYHKWQQYATTTDSIAPESGYYYISLYYTPERTIPDTNVDRALLVEKLHIQNTNNTINELENLKRQSYDFLTGLNDRARLLLKTILENAVFTKDVQDLIIQLDGELAEKGEIIVAYPNKYVRNQYGDLGDSSVMSVLKDYYINPTKEITFYIDNGGNLPLTNNYLILWDENGEYLGYYMMSNAGRTNVEWKMKWTGSEQDIARFRIGLYTDYIDNSYAYETNSGIIIYAGKNSRYANKRTIWDD